MSRGPEANFWSMLKRRLKERKSFFTRVENRAGGGIPDTYISDAGVSFWIEMKVEKSGRAKLRTGQIAWDSSHWQKGGTNFYLVLTKDQGHRTAIYIFAGSKGPDLMEEKCVNVENLYYGFDIDSALDLMRQVAVVRLLDRAAR